jgi:hypothetical protein
MANLTAADLDFTLTFDYDTGEVFYTDNLDYSAFNVPTSTIRGLGQCANPLTGTLFLNKMSPASALISDLSVTTKVSADYTLPTDSSTGAIINGSYSFLYAVYVPYTATNQAITSFGASNTIVVNGQDYGWMEAGDTFTVASATTPGNNGAKTVVSVVVAGGNSTITIAEAVTVEAGGSATLTFAINKQYEKTKTQSYTGCDQVTPILTLTSDCTQGQFGSITATDNTVYGSQTIVDRTIQLYAPNGLVPAPTEDPWETTSSTESSLTVAELATGVWTGILQADLSYTGTDGLVVTYSLTAPTNTFTTTVECGTQLCDIDGCLANFWASFNSCSAATPDMILKANKLSLALALYETAKNCGDTTAMASYLDDIQDILGDSCTCSDSTSTAPQWINNNSASGQTTIDQLVEDVTNLTNIVNSFQTGTELLFNANWTVDGDSSWSQIVPFTIPQEYYAVGTEAPYYPSNAYAELRIDFKVASAAANIKIYNQTDGTTWLDLDVGTLMSGTGSGTIWVRWSSWNSACAINAVYQLEVSGNLIQDEVNLAGVADWTLTEDLLVNIIPDDITSILFSQVSCVGYKQLTAGS